MNAKIQSLLFFTVFWVDLCFAQTFDSHGDSEILPIEPESNWVFIGSSLVDVVDNKFLGVAGVNGGMGSSLTISDDNRFMFTAESFYSRGNRGQRTDKVLSIINI